MSAEPPTAQALPEHLQALLKPLSPDAPAGPPMRFDPLFTTIRLDREEDDPTLPMRQWERPLKLADWPSVERRCLDFLRSRSKDLQMAAWTLEAWFRQRELVGLHDGLILMSGLLQQFWDTVHPVIDEDGDCDARVAPFEWLNEELPVWLRTRVVLARFPGYKPTVFTLADWIRLSSPEAQREAQPNDRPQKSRAEPEDPVPPVTRELVVEELRGGSWRRIVEQLQQCRACLQEVAHINRVLRERLDTQAPSLAKMSRELETLERVLQQMLAAAEMPTQTGPVRSPIEESAVNAPIPQAGASLPAAVMPAESAPASLGAQSGTWATRAQAYSTLEAIADFLAKTEPHSPTPYLIRRAVNWGRMSLPELMAEIQREEGDLNKLVSLLSVGHRDERYGE